MIYDLVTKYGFNAPSLAAVKQLLWLALAHAPSDLANEVFRDSLAHHVLHKQTVWPNFLDLKKIENLYLSITKCILVDANETKVYVIYVTVVHLQFSSISK